MWINKKSDRKRKRETGGEAERRKNVQPKTVL